jgi:pimeloyl-ACP methyl ester carboxylesterase
MAWITGSSSKKRAAACRFCLHTAGADSRQFRHVLNDKEVARRFRVIAFDFPWHGRSNPPGLMRYRLTTKAYLGIVRGSLAGARSGEAGGHGCSMGGAIVPKLAAEYQGELRGIIGLESAAYAPAATTSSCITRDSTVASSAPAIPTDLCSPFSPEENRRRTGGTTASRDPASTRRRAFLQQRLGCP